VQSNHTSPLTHYGDPYGGAMAFIGSLFLQWSSGVALVWPELLLPLLIKVVSVLNWFGLARAN
jgi:hypothetical protein